MFDGYTRIRIPQTGLKVDYHEKDPIFDLSEPHCLVDPKIKKPQRPIEKCFCCRQEKPKKVLQCEFCALWGCQTCISKTLPFPMVEDEVKHGLICFICEAKVHIHNLTAQIVDQLKMRDKIHAQKELDLQKLQQKKIQTQRELEIQKSKLQDA